MSIYDIIAGGGNQLGSGMQTGLNMGLQLREAKQSEDKFTLESMLKKKEDTRAEEKNTREQEESDFKKQERERLKAREARRKELAEAYPDPVKRADAAMEEGDTEYANDIMQYLDTRDKLDGSKVEKYNEHFDRMTGAIEKGAMGIVQISQTQPENIRVAHQEYLESMAKQFPNYAKDTAQKTKDMTDVQLAKYYEREAARSKDFADMRKQERAQEAAKELEKLKQEDKAKNANEFKSADAGVIYRMAVGYHGGLFDDNGNVKMLDPNLTGKVAELSSKAARLKAEGKAITHNEAITMAAQELKHVQKKVYNSKEDIGMAYKNKEITKDEATKLLKEFDK